MYNAMCTGTGRNASEFPGLMLIKLYTLSLARQPFNYVSLVTVFNTPIPKY